MRLVAALATVVVLIACNMGGGPAGLTVEQLTEAQGKVHAMQPKDLAMEALSSLGEPAKKDDAGASWFAKDGDGCKELRRHVDIARRNPRSNGTRPTVFHPEPTTVP